MVWGPEARDDVVNVATPLALRTPVPSEVAPSWKIIVPVATVLAAVTVAVNVTDVPAITVDALLTTASVVDCFRLSMTGDDVLGELFASPA